MTRALQILGLQYFSQGVVGGYLSFVVVAQLVSTGLGVREIGMYSAIVGLPWGLKLFFGPLVDGVFPSYMYPSRRWIVLSLCAVSALMLCLSIIPPGRESFTLLVIVAATANIFVALGDVATDRYAVETLTASERTSGSTAMAVGNVSGYAFSTLVLSSAVIWLGRQVVGFALATGMLFCVHWVVTRSTITLPSKTAVQLSDGEEPLPLCGRPNSWWDTMLSCIRLSFSGGSLYLIVGFGIVQLTVGLRGVVSKVIYIRDFGWSETSLPLLMGTALLFGALAAAFFTALLLRKFSLHTVFCGLAFVDGILTLAFGILLGLSLGHEVSLGYLYCSFTILNMELIVGTALALQLCWKRFGGTHFAVYMTTMNMAALFGAVGASALTRFVSDSTLFLIAGTLLFVVTPIVLRTRLNEWTSHLNDVELRYQAGARS